jgi:serine/threonine protein kinase
MLTGRHPWPDHDNHFTTMYAIVNNPEGPPRPPSLDPLVGSFLDDCLKHDFRDRPTASQLLQHPWIAGEQAGGGQQ